MSAVAPVCSAEVEVVLSRLRGVHRRGSGWIARCPAHDDQKASLSIGLGDDGRVLLKCFANCKVDDIVSELGLEMSDLFTDDALRSGVTTVEPTRSRIVATYDYVDENRGLLFQAVRKEPKDFSQRQPDGIGGWIWSLKGARLVPYHLDELVSAATDRDVWVLEGEKDVDRARREFGLLATCNPMGAGKWQDAFSEFIAGRNVTIVPDNDEAGRKHADQVAASLHRAGCRVRIVELPNLPIKGDLSDWIDGGGTKDELIALAENAADWTPGQVQLLERPPLPRPEATWPVIDTAAFHGLAGEIVWAIDPTTEADPIAVLVTLLASFGSACGRGPHVMIGDDRHGTNLFATLVGDTGDGRKGTSDTPIDRLMLCADEVWVTERKQGGLSTGEGLIHAIRDPRTELNKKTGEEVVVDAGVADKRLLCKEEELSFVLKTAARQGNTVTEIIRRAWDSRGALRVMTKSNPSAATNPHVSIVAHITKAELTRNVTETEMANGFLNRFLWIVVRRSKFLPEPKRLSDAIVTAFALRLRQAKDFAVKAGELRHDAEAAKVWHVVYPELASCAPGLAGALTARAAPIVRRLALIYALLDQSPTIRREHLEAALAVWDFSTASVQFVFGDLTGDAVADRIMAVLRRSGELSQAEISDIFGRNVPAHRLGQAFEVLLAAGKVAFRTVEPASGRGRPRTLWRAIT